RGAVDEALHARRRGPRELQHAPHRGGDALEEVLRRRRDLGELESPLAVEGHDVGEGAADVDADLHRARASPDNSSLIYAGPSAENPPALFIVLFKSTHPPPGGGGREMFHAPPTLLRRRAPACTTTVGG